MSWYTSVKGKGDHGRRKKMTVRKTSAVIVSVMMMFIIVGMATDVYAASVRLNKKSVTMDIGKTYTLKVKGTKQKAKWSSSDKAVVTVSKTGKLTAKKDGKATVYAKVAGKKLKCKVTVRALSQYWTKDSSVAKELRDYVAKVTNAKDKKNFIPVKDRIAVFDMDGTLTCETYFTYYDTMMFIEYCLVDHPDRVSDELKEVAKEIKPGYIADEALARNFARAYAGMTTRELFDYAVEFGNKYTKSFENMKYHDGLYLPMGELVKYLYDNDFTVYVISGTERTTSRAIISNSTISDYVSPSHIIGTEFEVKGKGHEYEPSNMNYKYFDGDDLVYSGGFIQKNLNAQKAIEIEREIGQRPVLAFGNSGSDTSMMNYTLDKRNPYPAQAYMVVADDDVREWGKQDWDKKSKEYIDEGYIPVSMKMDFNEIYPQGIVPAEKQYWGPDEKTQSDRVHVHDVSAIKYRNAA